MLFLTPFSSSPAMVTSEEDSATIAWRRSFWSGRLKVTPREYMSEPSLPIAFCLCMYSKETLKSG